MPKTGQPRVTGISKQLKSIMLENPHVTMYASDLRELVSKKLDRHVTKSQIVNSMWYLTHVTQMPHLVVVIGADAWKFSPPNGDADAQPEVQAASNNSVPAGWQLLAESRSGTLVWEAPDGEVYAARRV